jgi:outer membrane protein assembly factor BamE (lipoprotein component of BamABCDE complex)
MKTFLFVTLIICTLGACTPTTATRGNYLYAEDIRIIQPQVTTQRDVLNLLGTPTAKAVFDENTWYYVGLKTEKESFFDEKVTAKQVYKIAFDETGLVQSLEEVKNDSVDVPIASRVTPTSGNEVTFIQQVLGNIGKFNPATQ